MKRLAPSLLYDRLDSFSKAGKLVEEAGADPEMMTPLLLNATYTALRTVELALRYSAIGFIKTVVDVVRKRDIAGESFCKWFDVLIAGCLFGAVKEAVKSKQEVYY